MRKIIIITGASSGMGVCFANQLACEKNRTADEMWLIARREDRLLKVRDELKDKINARTFVMDLSGKEGAQNFKELLEEENKTAPLEISVLVNNAGFGTYGEFADTDTDREMQMIDLNCTALTGITGYSLPFMKAGSRIINVASLAAYGPLGNFAVYGATKAYVLSFTTALRAELKQKGIKVTALCPGSVSTEFANVASNGARKEVLHGKSADKTVRDALKKSRKGKAVAMWALKWKINSKLCTYLPSTLIAWATWRFAKRPSK